MTSASPATSRAAGAAPGQKRGWWPLAVIASAHLMAVLDTTVMFVALPSAQHALDLTVTARQWVVTAYTLALAGLLLPAGRFADRFGARRTLLIGVVGFALASAVGGASVTGVMLIAARAVQGAFAAVLVSSTKSLLITVYTERDERARAIGIFTATLTAGMAAGFILGGVLTTELSWRWCLYVNVGLSLVAIIGAPRVLPAPSGRREARIDLVGALLRLVLERNRGAGYLALIVNGLSTFGMLLVLTYQVQSVMRGTPLQTGLALIPFALTTTAGAAVIAPVLMKRMPLRWLVIGSIVVEAAGLVPLAWLTPSSGYLPLILIAIVIEGLGTGIAGPTALSTALRAVRPADTGAAGAVTSAASQLGSSIGAALLNTIAATATASYLAAHTAASAAEGTVHGFAVAMVWGAAILLIAALPIGVLINAKAPARPS